MKKSGKQETNNGDNSDEFSSASSISKSESDKPHTVPVDDEKEILKK